MNNKIYTPFYSIFYTIIPIVIIYFGFTNKYNIFDKIYNQLILNNNENYLKKYFYNQKLIPSKYPVYFLNKDGTINHNKLKECPMTIDDINDNELNFSNFNNQLNNSNEFINKKKQKKIDEFFINLKNSKCGCLPVPEKIFTTSYLCRTVGFSYLFKLSEDSKNNNIIYDLYKNIQTIDLEKNSNNLFMGQIPYDASKKFIYILFAIIKSLCIFNIIKLWIYSITYINLYNTISGSNVKVKKNKKIYFEGSNKVNIPVLIIFITIILSSLYLLPIIIIHIISILQIKKLSTLKNIIYLNLFKKSYIYLTFFLIFYYLIYDIFSSSNSIILNIVKKGFNKKDKPFINKISKSFSLSHHIKKPTFNYFILQFIIITVLIYSFYIGFTSNNSFIYIFPILIYTISFFMIYNSNNEGKFNDIFTKCPESNANSYSYTNKLINKPFWNITSAFIKYNYKHF